MKKTFFMDKLRLSMIGVKFKKQLNPLKETKEVYKQRNQFEELELKEFSLLFLAINNLDLFRKNIELISEIVFSKNSLNELKQKLIEYLLSEKFFDQKKMQIQDLEKKYKNTVDQINDNAPIKVIYSKKNEDEILSLFNEIMGEIKRLNLEKKLNF